MISFGLYQPGTSAPHRAPAGLKFVATLAVTALIFLVSSLVWLGVLTLAVLLCYALARITPQRCWRAARALIPLTVLVVLAQWWARGPDDAVLIGLRLLATMACANLFTLTTKIDDLISAVESALRPARRLGVRPERVGLLVGLTVQAIATLAAIANEVREAQRARDTTRSVRAFAVPFLVRTLRHADELGEALAARGIDEVS
jgi:biotin transport system permease protein